LLYPFPLAGLNEAGPAGIPDHVAAPRSRTCSNNHNARRQIQVVATLGWLYRQRPRGRYMTDVDGTPVLWLYGPPGVGKTTVGWELYTQLAQDGISVGYVDIDQLGMCYAAPTSQNWAPEPAADPGRHRLKAASLNAVLPNFRAASAQCVIASGVVDADRRVEVDLISNAELTRCRLRVDAAELRSRIAVRGRPADEVEECVRMAEALDLNHSGDGTVDTTGLSVAGVVAQVRAHIGAWPHGPTASRQPDDATTSGANQPARSSGSTALPRSASRASAGRSTDRSGTPAFAPPTSTLLSSASTDQAAMSNACGRPTLPRSGAPITRLVRSASSSSARWTERARPTCTARHFPVPR
jgi:hypothetical protein